MISKMNPDWTLLPSDLLKLISEKATTNIDFVSFRAVHTAWRSASSSRPQHLPPQLPWLILPHNPDEEDANYGSTLSFYDPSQSKTHILDLHEIQGKRICGSSHGWLVLEKEREVWLFNPITRDQISLPSLSAQPDSFLGTLSGDNFKDGVFESLHNFCIKKAILSSNPGMNHDCLVMALFRASWETAFCRIGDDCWTTLTIEDNMEPDAPLHVVDINYHNDLFYAIHANGHAWICNIGNPGFKYIPSTIGDYDDQEVDYICTVEGGGSEHGLMVLSRDYAYWPTHNPLHMCSTLMLPDEQENWVNLEEEHLRNNIFFLGGLFHCVALPAAAMQTNGWEGNCICYIHPKFETTIDDVDWYSYNVNLFRFDDHSVTTLATHLGFVDENKYLRCERNPCFLWLTPTLC